VELRGHGAYVIAPPSVHPGGARYKWRTTGPVTVGLLPPLPGELPPAGNGASVAGDWGTPAAPEEPLTPGRRNSGLLLVAGSLLARRVYEPDLLTGALLEANRNRCRPPLSGLEVRRVALWAASSQEALRIRVEDEIARRLFRAWREDVAS
jgi:hypothetical protein